MQKNYGKALKQLRKEKRVNQEDLLEALGGISRSAYSQKEINSSFSKDELKVILKALKLKEDEFYRYVTEFNESHEDSDNEQLLSAMRLRFVSLEAMQKTDRKLLATLLGIVSKEDPNKILDQCEVDDLAHKKQILRGE